MPEAETARPATGTPPPEAAADPDPTDFPSLSRIEDYAPLIGEEAVGRILGKAHALRAVHIENVNSTFYGGGVAEILTSLTLLLNQAGIATGWRVLQGRPDFFSVTKKMHNALQGASIRLTEPKKRIYEEVVYENALRMHFDHDVVIIHDPQPLPLISHFKPRKPGRGPWIWRCHIDLTAPNRTLWRYLKPWVEAYDAVILSIPEYRQRLRTPQRFIMPAIDPFILKNRPLSDAEIDERLTHYGLPVDRPFVAQIGRFDPWKDPRGVIEAWRLARREVDCDLILLGNIATDDPEGQEIYESLLECRCDPGLHILSVQDTALVNAVQRRALVILQKSLREGFGLTVSEAMWKGTPVIGGNVGGIRYQIRDGENGFLVSSIEEAARRIVELVRDPELRRRLGERGRETVRERFLMSRLMEDYLDLIASFELHFRLREHPVLTARGPATGYAAAD